MLCTLLSGALVCFCPEQLVCEMSPRESQPAQCLVGCARWTLAPILSQFCSCHQLFMTCSPILTGFGYGPPPPPPDQFAPPGVPPPPATPGAAPLAFPPPPSQAAPDMSKPPTAQPDFPYGQYGKWLWPAVPRTGRSRRGYQTGFWDAGPPSSALWECRLPGVLLSPWARLL